MSMEIQRIEAFDLYGDGTLILRTHLADGTADTRYAWYITRGKQTLFKTPYRDVPFMAYQVPAFGTYQITAYANQGKRGAAESVGSKVKKSVTFTANQQTSPLLDGQRTVSPAAIEENGPLFERLREEAESMPKSTGSRFYEPLPLKVGLICDPFVYYDFQGSCDLRFILPETPESELRELDLLLVASVWHGLHNEWTHAGHDGWAANVHLRRVQRFCREAGIPVAFYSKEDPPNFDYFQNLAREADVIFTSAEEMIPRYQKLFPDKAVFALPFFVNPSMYHPIGAFDGQIRRNALFAGSWIPKYPERIEAQEHLFDWCRSGGLKLHILDRNSRRDTPNYRYPMKYYRSVLPNVDYLKLGGFYKIHDYVINLNSVTDSATMFAKRVYDALACGSVVLSNHSLGMERRFPVVFPIEQPEDVTRALSEGHNRRYQRRIEGIRLVMSGNTSYDRMRQIAAACGAAVPERKRTAAVLLDPAAQNTEALEACFQEQTYPDRILVHTPEELDAARDCDMIAVWKEGASYGSHYLEDMVNAFKYTNCRYVTKHAFSKDGMLRQGAEHRYVEMVKNKFCTLFWRDGGWPEDLSNLPESFSAPDGYAADHLNYEEVSR